MYYFSLDHQYSLFYICPIFTWILLINLDQKLIASNHYVVEQVNLVSDEKYNK
jgi:hypothetical protein